MNNGKVDFSLEHLQNLTDEQKELMSASKLRRYKRDKLLKEIVSQGKQEEIDQELRRCIRNLELQLADVKEKYNYLSSELLTRIERQKRLENESRVFGLEIPLITYNDCNDTMYDTNTNKKSVRNSKEYNEYKQNLWNYFDENKDDLLKMIPTLKDKDKYIKIIMSFHVDNMNKDTDNIEKPFLDTLFNWLNYNYGKLYSDNQIITKESVLTSTTRNRCSGTIIEKEQVYFQIFQIDEEVAKHDNDMLYRLSKQQRS